MTFSFIGTKTENRKLGKTLYNQFYEKIYGGHFEGCCNNWNRGKLEETII